MKVEYPWQAGARTLTGIPPHVSMLNSLTVIREEQRDLIDGFVRRVKSAVKEIGLAGGAITEQQMKNLFDSLATDLRNQIDEMNANTGRSDHPATNDEPQEQRVEDGTYRYGYHLYDGKYNRLPKDYRIPRGGLFTLWHHGNIGDTVQSVPPLRQLSSIDYKHLDKIPLSPEEQVSKVGRRTTKRRPASQLWSAMKCTMDYLEKKIIEVGAKEAVITVASVERMYAAVESLFVGGRNDQKQWTSWVNEVEKMKRLETAANKSVEVGNE